MKSRFSRLALLALALLPATGGCATQQALQQYEEEIVRLREEKTMLGKDNQGLLSEVSRLEAELARGSFSSPVDVQPAAAPATTSDVTNSGVDVFGRGSDIVYRVPNTITFSSGSATLSATGQSALQAVARDLMSQYPDRVFWIEGHTDSDQPTKSKSKYATNRELSLARGKAVHEYMVLNCSVPDSQCVVAGHGEYQPVVPNSSSQNKAMNRRVDIVVKPVQ